MPDYTTRIRIVQQSIPRSSKPGPGPLNRAWCLGLVLVALVGSAAEQKSYHAARSVHLSYPASEGVLFYNELIVEESVNGSYFMACGWNTGYFGVQQLDSPDDKVVLFSVWDPTKGNDPGAVKGEDRVEVLYSDPGVRIRRFGGEGTGGQCMWRHPWTVGQTNQFLIEAKVDGLKTAYTGWIRGGPGDSWRKLVTFRTRTGGLLLRGYYSFVEDFRRDGNSVKEVRRARFGNGWIKTGSGEWLPLDRARFTGSNAEWEAPDSIDAGIEAGWFYLATGGDTRQTRELRSMIELQTKPAAAPIGPIVLPALNDH